MKKRPFHLGLLLSIVLLLIVGVLFVASASSYEGLAKMGNNLHFIKRHLVFLLTGLCFFVLASRMSIDFIRRMSLPFFVLSVFLCALLYTPLGVSHYNSVRWLKIPLVGFEFMPSDLLKYASIFYLSDYLVKNRRTTRKFKTFAVIIGIIGLSTGLVILRDFSTGMVIGLSLLSLFFVLGMEPYQYALSGLGGGALAFLMIRMMPYRMERMMSFIDPFDDIQDTDWQLANSLFAHGIGGFWGVGYLNSRLKQGYLPMSYNDFIFPIIGEEWGFLGTTFVVLLYFIFTLSGLQVASRCKNLYEQLIATGITVCISIQAFFNMGVTIGILPVTGLTLPFISYGGTSLWVCLVAAGILLGRSKNH